MLLTILELILSFFPDFLARRKSVVGVYTCLCHVCVYVEVSWLWAAQYKLRLLADTPLMSGSILYSKRICIASSGLCTVNWPNRKQEWTLKWHHLVSHFWMAQVIQSFTWYTLSTHSVLCAELNTDFTNIRHGPCLQGSSELGMGNRVVKR